MRDSSEFGINATGDYITVKIEKGQRNNLMMLDIKASNSIRTLRSLESIKSEYRELDHSALDKIYKKIADSKSKDLEKLVKDFEKDLSKLIKDFEKDLSNY